MYIFIDGNLLDSTQLKLIINCALERFSHVYILNKSSSKKTNDNNDPSGLYLIREITNAIKCYSLMLNINIEKDYTNNNDVHVDYIMYSINNDMDIKNLFNIIDAKVTTFYVINTKNTVIRKKSVVVLDLDETLINREGKIIITDLHKYLGTLKTMFTYVVLWTHGCQRHANNIFQNSLASYKNYFDLVIVRNSNCQKSKKGLGYILKLLNEKYGVMSLSDTMLIDDQKSNYNYDYDYFIHVPRYNFRTFSTIMFRLLSNVQHEINLKNKM
ncbi:38K protein [Macrobrachium rosenbergii nudivirus]|nr:38K protein [Macrobrachium rosenbergii nudivirus]